MKKKRRDKDPAIKPKYTKEFQIKVGTIAIDRSLPKIFIE